ncbi:MAG: hypothetical protein M1825_002779 [Sarcosagium campestre]|nr:MAG: hypothetical protein M1825_002779 [Sarcosagium campestre]
MNHVEFDQRLKFVHKLLQEEFGLEPQKIEPLEYDQDCPFPYNNFVYRVVLPKQPRLTRPCQKPGTTPLPAAASSLVVRLSNPAAGLNDHNRVQNEVAFISLIRDALRTLPRQLVPAVYGWSSAANGKGWILLQDMPGKPLDTEFVEMDMSDKRSILRQIAEILALLQQYRLPDTIKSYGGLDFNGTGDIISGSMTTIHGGPFQTYEALYREKIQLQLAEADRHPLVQGWQSRDIRQRLDTFITQGLDEIVQSADSKKVLVHGDFTTNNFLFDRENQRISAILDFDWAQVSGIAEEFFRSLGDVYGQLPGPYCNEAEQSTLRSAILQGFPDPLPSSESGVSWETAAAWDEELARGEAQTPRTIRGIAALSEVYWLSENICPFLLFNSTVLAQRTEEQKNRDKESTEESLIKFLSEHGY